MTEMLALDPLPNASEAVAVNVYTPVRILFVFQVQFRTVTLAPLQMPKYPEGPENVIDMSVTA
ncbi:MAG: hypothetical protein OEQ39_23035, partial [Gammaproteobacteria bacterium]|nr:hypothetical protein [Gammaproteobacteria bacterium]